MRTLRALAGAFAYFTTIPLGRFADVPPPDATVLAYLPLVGAVVGFLAGSAAWLVSRLVGDSFGPAITALAVSVALTGAIHVDGFLDCCDGILVTAAPARRLEILRDPRHGTFAVVGMALVTLAWVYALARLSPASLPFAVAFTAALARLAAISNAWIFPYGPGGTATLRARQGPSVIGWAIALAVLFVAAWAVAPPLVASILIAVAVSLGIARFAANRLGGVLTGDVYGAIVVIDEIILLLAFGMTVAPVR